MIELNWIKEIKIGMRYIFVHEAEKGNNNKNQLRFHAKSKRDRIPEPCYLDMLKVVTTHLGLFTTR